MDFRKWFVATALLVVSTGASADPCVGPSPFTDVPDSEIYCSSTQWLKNRNITLGCGGTNFCPLDVVTRASMALFLNRLGVALTPLVVQLDDDSGAINLDATTIVCQTFDINTGTYQRTATAHMTFSGRIGGPLNLRADLVASTDGGMTWNALSPGNLLNRVGGSVANVWVNTSQTLSRSFLPGTEVRFGIRIFRIDGMADVTESRCFMNVQMGNRNEPLF